MKDFISFLWNEQRTLFTPKLGIPSVYINESIHAPSKESSQAHHRWTYDIRRTIVAFASRMITDSFLICIEYVFI